MLRQRFEQEADALWTHLQRLGQQAPRLEGLYARDADPRVARLVQSAAFAFSAASGQLEDDGQALVRPLVARAMPELLRPRPSSTILQVAGVSGRAGSVQGASFAARVGAVEVPFQVVWPATLAPLALEDVRIDRLHAQLQILRFSLVGRNGVSAGNGLPDVLRFFLQLEPRSLALDVLHALRSGEEPIVVKGLGPEGEVVHERKLGRDAFAWVRVDTQEPALVSARADRFQSSTLLRDLFGFPESFCFFDLRLAECRGGKATRFEISLPMGRVVDGASALTVEHLQLFCAPATNQYVAPVEPVATGAASECTVAVSRRPHAEVLEVRDLYTESVRDAGRRIPLRSWEAPEEPHTFGAAEAYYMLEQSDASDGSHVETRARFGTLARFPSPVGGVVRGEVLATDGQLTATVGLGDVGSSREGATNITRVTPARRAPSGDNHAWRMSAYGRMPSYRLTRGGHLSEFVTLHDWFGVQEASVRFRPPRILGASHALEHALADGVIAWGDVFTLDVDATGCGAGELWLLGHLIHQALFERSERLRFSKLSLRRGGEPFADYAAHQGARLPFPLG